MTPEWILRQVVGSLIRGAGYRAWSRSSPGTALAFLAVIAAFAVIASLAGHH